MIGLGFTSLGADETQQQKQLEAAQQHGQVVVLPAGRQGRAVAVNPVKGVQVLAEISSHSGAPSLLGMP